MKNADAYNDFIERLGLLIKKQPKLMTTTLSNIFTMRIIGNKTHGDLAEIAIAEFINQYMYDFKSTHVGKDLYRAKSKEEDIVVKNEVSNLEFPVSLKAYGDGPLQLSTDKNADMYPLLEKYGDTINSQNDIKNILNNDAFSCFNDLNILPLIYDEENQKCNILIFNFRRAKRSISYVNKEKSGKGRKHPVYKFFDHKKRYICEVRYGDATANALQRGLWTHTKNGLKYFISVTGWINYSHNLVLVELFSHSLVSSEAGHKKAIAEIKKDIAELKEKK